MSDNIFEDVESADESDFGPDVVGGGSNIVDTGIYDGTIVYAYARASQSSKARAVVLSIKLDNGAEITSTLWTVNSKGTTLSGDGKTNNRAHLLFSSLCLLTTGKTPKEIGAGIEKRVLNVYDFDKKGDVPTELPCFVELHGKRVACAIQRIKENKQKKVGEDYVKIADSRELNDFSKFFHAENPVTASEIAAYVKSKGAALNDIRKSPDFQKACEKTPVHFSKQWLEKNEGQTWDRREIKGDDAGSSGGQSEQKASEAVASLFDDDD